MQQIDNIVPINNKEKRTHRIDGFACSVLKEADGRWRAKLVYPLRPLVFNKQFNTKTSAENWIRSIITSLGDKR